MYVNINGKECKLLFEGGKAYVGPDKAEIPVVAAGHYLIEKLKDLRQEAVEAIGNIRSGYEFESLTRAYGEQVSNVNRVLRMMSHDTVMPVELKIVKDVEAPLPVTPVVETPVPAAPAGGVTLPRAPVTQKAMKEAKAKKSKPEEAPKYSGRPANTYIKDGRLYYKDTNLPVAKSGGKQKHKAVKASGGVTSAMIAEITKQVMKSMSHV